MVRILFITQSAQPLGGVEVWLEHFVAELAREHEITTALTRGHFHDPDAYLARHALAGRTTEVHSYTGTAEGRVRALVRAIESARADVVVPVNIVEVLEAARRVKARRDLRVLYPLHGTTSEYFLDARAYRGVIDFAAGTSRLATRALVAVSQLPEKRVRYAPVGVEPASARPSFEPASPLRLVFVGRLTQPHKRVRDLVAVCDALDARGVAYALDVAGDGDQRAHLESSLGARPHVRFHGALSREELYRRIYPNASALLVLSDSETGPLAAWEAMRHGGTLVTTAYLGLRSEGRIRDGENALVVPVGDVDAIAGAVQRLASDPPLLERLRRAAYATAERECTFEVSDTAWRDAFERCLAMPIRREAVEFALPRSGSLDALGAGTAEALRVALRRRASHAEAGSEWPHTFHPDARERSGIDARIAELDV